MWPPEVTLMLRSAGWNRTTKYNSGFAHMIALLQDDHIMASNPPRLNSHSAHAAVTRQRHHYRENITQICVIRSVAKENSGCWVFFFLWGHSKKHSLAENINDDNLKTEHLDAGSIYLASRRCSARPPWRISPPLEGTHPSEDCVNNFAFLTNRVGWFMNVRSGVRLKLLQPRIWNFGVD